MTELAPFVAIVAVFALVANLASLVQAGLEGAASRWLREHAEGTGVAASLARRLGSAPAFHAARVVLPVMIGLGVALALAAPSLDGNCHCMLQHDHPHLCFAHPTLAADAAQQGLIVVGLWAVLSFPRLVGLARGLHKSSVIGRLGKDGRASRTDGVDVRLVDAAGLGAVTVGLFSPSILVERSLWSRLDAYERRTVAHHEDAHRRRRDGFSLVALHALGALVFASEPRVDAWRLAAEKACDAHAARRIGDPLLVARSLIAFARKAGGSRPPDSARLVPSALGPLEERVHALLSDRLTTSRRTSCDVARIAVYALAVVAVVVATSAGAVHHAVETTLGHVVSP